MRSPKRIDTCNKGKNQYLILLSPKIANKIPGTQTNLKHSTGVQNGCDTVILSCVMYVNIENFCYLDLSTTMCQKKMNTKFETGMQEASRCLIPPSSTPEFVEGPWSSPKGKSLLLKEQRDEGSGGIDRGTPVECFRLVWVPGISPHRSCPGQIASVHH